MFSAVIRPARCGTIAKHCNLIARSGAGAGRPVVVKGTAGDAQESVYEQLFRPPHAKVTPFGRILTILGPFGAPARHRAAFFPVYRAGMIEGGTGIYITMPVRQVIDNTR